MKESQTIDGQLNLSKQCIVDTLMSDQHLLKYLKYKENNIDIPSQPDLSLEERIMLKNKNIYEYRKAPSTESLVRDIWISMEYGMINRMEASKVKRMTYFSKPTFYFYIITLDELDKCLNGSRLYAIEDRLVKLFWQKEIMSLGQSYILGSEPMQLPYPYVGRRVTLGFYALNEGVQND